jgi:hypothetical protein
MTVRLATIATMDAPKIPASIAGLPVPQDDVSQASWRWAHRQLPRYLLAHSVRSYCWGATIGEYARRTLERFGMPADAADRAAIAIILHMQPGVTLDDGVEAVLLDRGTGIDVRGVDVDLVASVRGTVTRRFPRGAFDRHFVSAIRREVARRGDCQSARLLNDADLEAAMARSPWAMEASPTC